MKFASEFDEKMNKSMIYLLNVVPMLFIAMGITWLIYMQVQIAIIIPGIFILALCVSAALINPLFLMAADRISDKIKSW